MGARVCGGGGGGGHGGTKSSYSSDGPFNLSSDLGVSLIMITHCLKKKGGLCQSLYGLQAFP